MTEKSFKSLSKREIEILDGLVELYDVDKVMLRLNYGRKTVSDALDSAKEKLGCDNCLQLALEFDRWRWKTCHDAASR